MPKALKYILIIILLVFTLGSFFMYAVYNRFLNRHIPTNISFEVSKGESKNQVLSKIALDFNLSPTVL